MASQAMPLSCCHPGLGPREGKSGHRSALNHLATTQAQASKSNPDARARFVEPWVRQHRTLVFTRFQVSQDRQILADRVENAMMARYTRKGSYDSHGHRRRPASSIMKPRSAVIPWQNARNRPVGLISADEHSVAPSRDANMASEWPRRFLKIAAQRGPEVEK